jgi:Zn-dependent M28 family amino/carboxypeptidase
LQISELKVNPKNRIRFAFWGAREFGNWGSREYVYLLSDDELNNIALYLNFEMLGSPNYVRFLYDGDGSHIPFAGRPAGSAEIEKVFEHYFAAKRLPTEPYPFDGRSDLVSFMDAGIPAGGLNAGFEQMKTEEQAKIYGGTAGAPYDPCYHRICDDITNISVKTLDEMSDGVAHVTLTFAKAGTLFVEPRRGLQGSIDR